MTRHLVLIFPTPQGQPHFIALNEEFGPEETDSLYHAMVERFLTECFPLSEDYSTSILSYHDPKSLKAWLGNEWAIQSIQGTPSPDFLNKAMDIVFQEEKVEKALLLWVGNMELSEEKISEWFNLITRTQIFYRLGSNDCLIAVGLHREQQHVLSDLDWTEPGCNDLIELRCEHFGVTPTRAPDQKTPTDLEELASFRDELPKEHYIAKKIDQLVLDKLGQQTPKFNPEQARTLKIDLDEEAEKDHS